LKKLCYKKYLGGQRSFTLDDTTDSKTAVVLPGSSVPRTSFSKTRSCSPTDTELQVRLRGTTACKTSQVAEHSISVGKPVFCTWRLARDSCARLLSCMITTHKCGTVMRSAASVFCVYVCSALTFYRAAFNAGWSSHDKAVCLSVLFVKRVICDKSKETCAHILMPHEKKNGWWGDNFSMKFWVKLTQLE